jgi:predicted MFS family arabinose efflux permease
MTTLLILAFAQFFYIASRAFQQLNVMHHKVTWLYMTSGVMAVCEVTIFGALGARAYFSFRDVLDLQAIIQFSLAVIPLWVGGSTGSHAAMIIHQRLR